MTAIAAIILLLVVTLGCSNAMSWMWFKGTKWRASNIDAAGDAFTVEFRSGNVAKVALCEPSEREVASQLVDWSNDYKVVTMTWGKGRYQGEIRGNLIEGSVTAAGSGLLASMTFVQE